MSNLKILLLAGGIIFVAILSVQNATVVSLKFLGWQSIQIPLGLTLTFFVAIGLFLSLFLFPKIKR